MQDEADVRANGAHGNNTARINKTRGERTHTAEARVINPLAVADASALSGAHDNETSRVG